jgi:CheY-like chemotaxis protein
MQDNKKAAVPIIALTANALKGDREQYLAAGMNDYLSKPFTEENLFTVIKRNLAMPSGLIPAGTQNQQQTIPVNNNACLYDLSMVRSVSGGDEAFIKKMVQLFIETVPPGLSDLQEALAKQEWQQMGKVAHKLKSTIDSMGIVALKDDIRVIENNGKHEKDTDALPPLIKNVTEVINACIVQLKKDFAL